MDDLNHILLITLIISLILTTGVYLTGNVDDRQYQKYGFVGSRFIILSYTFIYSLVNVFILLMLYFRHIHTSSLTINIIFFIVFALVCIGLVHTDTKNTFIEFVFDKTPLKNYFLNRGKYHD